MKNHKNESEAFSASIWVAVAALFFIWISIHRAEASEPIIHYLDSPRSGAYLRSSTLHWDKRPRVSIDDSALHLKDHINYAVWTLNQRTGLDMYFVPTKADIHISVQDEFAIFEVTQSFFTRGYAELWSYSDGRIQRAEIVLSSLWVNDHSDESRSTVVHEFVHALGVNYHLPSPKAVMYATAHDRYSLTYDDLAVLPYPQNCAPEVLPDGVYIPAVFGFDLRLSAELTVIADFISGGSCSGFDVTGTEQGISVMFPQVIGFEQSYKDVVLNYQSGQFTVLSGEEVDNEPTYRLFGAYQ